ncbi:MAG: hypothetical protein HQL54_05245 [Magnetococcales bacterium]|nr:hypothetical protein [Magnetococcales bacterium]
MPIRKVEISREGTVVHLKGFGLIKVFKIVSQKGDIEHWATNDVDSDELSILPYTEWSWAIENYHRGLKQFCGVERSQVRGAVAQRNHIGCAIRAFLRLERFSFATGRSWFDIKTGIVREAVRLYLAKPFCVLPIEATA